MGKAGARKKPAGMAPAHKIPAAGAPASRVPARKTPAPIRGTPFPLVISGPSGVGKTSIIDRLLATDSRLRLSVSATTRGKRSGEVAGKDYWFISGEEFARWREDRAFVEWAEVHGHAYGTPREPVERWLTEGCDVLLDIDTQGGLKIKQVYPRAVLVFLLPPSWSELESRLRGRASDADTEVERRLENAAREIAAASAYDYFVVNADLSLAVGEIQGIARAERLRVSRFEKGLGSLLGGVPPAGCGRGQGGGGGA